MRRGFIAHRLALKFLLALSIAGCAFAGGALTGTVVDESGAGIPKAAVLLVPDSDRVAKYQTVTDDNGRFEIAQIVPGEYLVRGVFRPFRGTAARVLIKDNEKSAMKLVLKLPNCDDPGVFCDTCMVLLIGQTCDYKEPLVLVRLDLSPNCAADLDTGRSRCDGIEQSDLKLETEGGKVFLVLLNGAKLCDGAEKRLRIDGFGQGNEWCVITDKNNRSNVQIAQSSVDPGMTNVRLRIETMKK
jgi:hypothetical protein